MTMPELTNELFNDLLDPRVPTLDVCRRHGVPITDLRRVLESPEFQEAAQALIAAEELRAAALAPDRRERALATLDAITQQEPTTPSHTECIRRAAGALLRATRPEPGASTRAPATPADDAPSPSQTPAAPADNTEPTTASTVPCSSSSKSTPSGERDALGSRGILPRGHHPSGVKWLMGPASAGCAALHPRLLAFTPPG